MIFNIERPAPFDEESIEWNTSLLLAHAEYVLMLLAKSQEEETK